ncbi:uncharacterized protein LTR77_006915 [Saxophila tyrrhenica]|uniref:Phosphate transporter n=1 Tax=Saxophila tyrrhenica TaxID=1690608 RepID=A0AAV9P9K9_9PEZI|nr:hypothetical protein LTR77_006915 [Saxophila tyrrhenica]
MAPAATAKYDWILALTTIAFVFSAFGNGANDVANAYATSVAARTLTMVQVGFLATCTEFLGAVALGSRVTDTIKNGIFNIERFDGNPGALMLAMGCAEVGNAVWLLTATRLGFPVSTTQTVVGSLIGVGFASQAAITWRWTSGSISQIASSWAIAPLLAGCFSAILFATLKYSVLERKDSFKWAMRMIPWYLGMTLGILTLFIVIEVPNGPDIDTEQGTIAGVILAVFFGVTIIGYVFFIPFFKAKLVREDPRIRPWHIPLGPLLLRENPPLYFPGKGDEFVTNYYEDAYGEVHAGKKDEEKRFNGSPNDTPETSLRDVKEADGTLRPNDEHVIAASENTPAMRERKRKYLPPRERFIGPVEHLSWGNPRKWFGYFKYFLLHGVTIDAVTHDSDLLRAVHAKAHKYDVRVEHMWTYCQVVSAMMMSIAHGSNDVANAVGPWAAVYQTFRAGVVSTESPTPVWFLVVAGLLLGLGFWFFGYHIVRALGNKITQMSPTRGFAIELGAAITVLLASRLGLPVSTTQCLTGAALGVALMNYDLGAVNWRQMAYIFCGWVLTLPCAGLISGIILLLALNTPHF